MFQKLVREHPTIKDHWQELLEKGYIENSQGRITLHRSDETSERVLLVRDEINALSYSIRAGKLSVTRGLDTALPQTQVFHVDQVGSLQPDVLEKAFDECEGFESAIRDLYRTLDKIVEEHKKNQPLPNRAKDWFKNKVNLIFLGVFITYTVLTGWLLAYHFWG